MGSLNIVTAVNMKNDIAGIVVTYNFQTSSLANLINELEKQVSKIFIIDNASKNQKELTYLEGKNTDIIRLSNNVGIAKAQNDGLREVRKQGFSKVIFFDQDSEITSTLVTELAEHMDLNGYLICSPSYFNTEYNFEYKVVDIDRFGFRNKYLPSTFEHSIEVSVAISSGMLVNTKVFEVVGLLDEGLFIDYVDTEWCLRCFSFGIKINIIPNVRMNHNIGDKTLSLFKLKVPIHSAFRRYYRVRNAFLLFHLDHVPIYFSIREIVFSVIHTSLLIITQPERLSYLKYLLKGIFDGLRKKKGSERG